MRKLLILIVLFLIGCQSTPEPVRFLSEANQDLELSCRNGIVHISCVVDTPTPTETPVPLTETPTPTSTETSTPTITPTPVSGVCPEHLNEWHEPQDIPCFHHHHGIDPRSDEVKAIFNIDGYDIERDFLDLYGELWQPLWLSSPAEERTGFIWALYENPTCIQSGLSFSGYDCITALLVRHHDTGTLDHLVKMIHSEAMIVKGCEKLSDGTASDVCGILNPPGRNAQYGMMHAAYKKTYCHLPGQPTNGTGGFPPLLQANYRTSRSQFSLNEFNAQYWVSVTTDGLLDQYYDHNFNETITNFAWAAEGWQFWPATTDPKVPDVSFCGVDKDFTEIQARLMEQPPIPGVEHRTFQVIDLRIDLPSEWTTQTIFWMDIYGNPLPPGTCDEPSGFCVPWLKTPNFPDRVALNYNAVFLGRCDLVPCFIADTFGVPMIFPPLDVP